MESELIKILNNSIKKYRFLYILCILFVGIYYIKKYNNEVYQIIVSTVLLSIELIYNYKNVIIFIVILVTTTYLLLKKSDSEFKKLLEKHYPDIDSWDSKDTFPIKTRIIENYRKSDNTREIVIFNELRDKIEQLKGRIEFFQNRKRIFQVSVDVSDIEVYRGERICKDKINESETNWNEFNIIIEYIKAGEYEQHNLKLFGVSFRKTHYLILNQFNYIRLWGKRLLPYEISWLKEKWYRNVFPRIKWHFRLRNTFSLFKPLPLKVILKDIFRNSLRIILTLPIVLYILWFMTKIFMETVSFIYDLCKLWITLVIDVIKVIL
ncbi:hypothetical protein [Lysinibacillus sp. Y5S-8]|uniref:hypothetical protein n=1 Tax=Lysinibacillus sp. Y5S-8 TaxID=3122488 RepID=UPI0030D0EA81